MALTPEEKKLMQQAKASGLTKEQAIAKLNDSRGSTAYTPIEKTPLVNRFTEAIGLGGATRVFGDILARQGVGTETPKEVTQQFIEKPTALETAGAVLQTAAIPAGAVITGGTSLAGQMAAGAGVGYLYDVGSDLVDGKSTQEVLTPGVGTAIGGVIPPALRGAGAAIGGVINGFKGAASAAPGVRQMGTELAERVPLAITRAGEAVETAAQKAEKIKTAPPAVGQAIKSGIDDVVIDAVQQADEPTLNAYRQMIEIAEQPRTGLRPATRPASVAGESVTEQYKILDKARNDIGQQIGDAVDQLSKQKGSVDVLPEQRMARDLLRQNGISPDVSGKLNFSGSALTPKQRTLVQDLYQLATQSEQLTPRQIYNYDKLFSQLQREARFDNLDTIFLKTPQGDVNIFRAFRNIYANKLDNVAPEIAPLNKQYAGLRNLQDDIESSIVKRGNFESNKGVDPSEFAQTNLRRIFSEAQSAADYRALADKLDAFARQEGYKGANPQDLAGFAERLKSIYPDTVPETSLRGGISTSIRDIIGKVGEIGKPGVEDQQKALRKLLEMDDAISAGQALTPDQGKSLQQLGERLNESSPSSVPNYLKNNKQAGFVAGDIKGKVSPESVAKLMDDNVFDGFSVAIDDIQAARRNPAFNRVLDDMKLSKASDEELVKFLKEATDEYEKLNR